MDEDLQKLQSKTEHNFDSQNCLEQIARHIPGIIYQFRLRPDGTSHFPYVSEGLREFYGIGPEAVREDGTPLFEKIHPDDLPRIQQSIADSAENLTPWSCEYRSYHRDGRLLWLHGHSTPEQQPDGSILWHGYIRDISEQQTTLRERKAKEIALQELTQQLQQAQKIAHIGNWSFDLATQKFTWSDEIFRIFGLTPEQEAPTLMEYLQKIHPEDRSLCQKHITEAQQGISQSFDFRILRPNGELRYLNQRIEVEYQQGQVVKMFGVIMDITKRKAAELELEQFFTISLDLLCIADMQGYFRRVNLAWEKTLGYTLEELENKPFLDFVHPDDVAATLEAMSNLQNQCIVTRFVNRYRAKNQTYRHIEWSCVPQGQIIYGAARDITERLQAEANVRASEQKLRSLFALSPLGIALNDMQGKFIEVNAATEDIIGYTLEELNQLSYWDLTPEKYTEDEIRHLESLNTIGRYGPYEKEYIRKNGQPVPVELIGMKVTGSNGQEYIWSIIADITQRQQAQEAIRQRDLQKSEAQTHALLEAIPDMMLRYNRSGILIDCKTSPDVSMAIAPQEFLGKNIYDALPRWLAEQVEQTIAATLATEQMQLLEYDLQIPEGLRSYESRFVKCGDDDVLSIIRDITNRKQAEAKVHSLLNRTQLFNSISSEIRNSLDLSIILQNAINAIFVELSVDICSFAWYQKNESSDLWVVIKEKKVPQLSSWLGSYSPQDFPEIFEHILTNQIYRVDSLKQLKDQSTQRFLKSYNVQAYVCLPVHTTGGQIGGFEMARISSHQPWQDKDIELLQDIGNQVSIAIYQAQLYQDSQVKTEELRNAYRELQDTQVQLIQAEKMSSLGQLVAGVAHEINNPVSFIYGNLQPASEYAHQLTQLIHLYQENYPNPPSSIANFIEELDLEYLLSDFAKLLESMKTGADRIRDIVKSLRTFSRLDEADLKAVDLHENIDSTLVILQNRLNGRAGNPEIKVIKNYGNLPLVECYIGLLNQVFMNLLANAIDAIEEQRLNSTLDYAGCITITTKISSENQVSISIQDNGWGMSPEVKARIFNPFFTTKPIGAGTGMGLPTSYQIITKNHQGQLSCFSTLGEGTEFVIELAVRASPPVQ